MADNRFLVQLKNPDTIGWLDVAARDSWEAAEAFAECRERMTGHEHRTVQLPTLTPAQLAEGDLTQERA